MKKNELKPYVRRQVDHGLEALAEEFDTPKQDVQRGERQLEAVLEQARIEDFVPALVTSGTRAELLEKAGDDKAGTADPEADDRRI